MKRTNGSSSRWCGLVALTFFVSACLLASEASAQGQRLSLETYLDMESVSDPQISPDGSRIIYTRRWVDKVSDRSESSLWIMNSDGSRNRQLLEGSGASWSPDGTRILFTTQGDPNGSQVFVRWMDDEGAVTQITRLEQGPSDPSWSPNGEWIAFRSRVDDQVEFASIQLPNRPDGATWTDPPKVVDRLRYKRDRQGYIDTGWTHIFVVPAEGGTPRQLTDGDWNQSGLAWSQDASEIYFTSYRTQDWDRPDNEGESEIYSVNVETGEISQLTDRRGPDSRAVPSPDGQLIAYIAGDEHKDFYRNQRIWVMNNDGLGSRLISGDYDRQSGNLRWAPDSSGLYFSVSREGYRSLHFVSIDGGVTQLTEGEQILSLSSFSDDGIAVGTISSAVRTGRPLPLPSLGPQRCHASHRGERGCTTRGDARRGRGDLVRL